MTTNSQELIKQLKEIKQSKQITYTAILGELTVNGAPSLSMTTLRRVFANGSENRASSFNYEETLMPIARAVRRLDGSYDDSPQAKEIEALKSLMSVQNEELDRVLELKEHLDASVKHLTEQSNEKDKLIKRLMDRLDQKDDIIQQFIVDLKQKDEIIKQLLGRASKL